MLAPIIAGTVLYARLTGEDEVWSYSGGDALADLARVGEAQAWPDEVLDDLLAALPSLDGWDDAEITPSLFSSERWDGDDNPARAWFGLAAAELQAVAGELPGAPELASAWRQRVHAAEAPDSVDQAQDLAEGIAEDTAAAASAAGDVAGEALQTTRQAAATAGQSMRAAGSVYSWVADNPVPAALFGLGLLGLAGWAVPRIAKAVR